MKKTLYTIVLLGLCASMYAGNPGGSAMSFVSIPENPTALSLGGATLGNSIEAGLLKGKTIDAGASYLMWSPSFVNEKFVNAGASFKLGSSLALGLDATYGMNEPYEVFGESGLANGTFTPADIKVGLSAAYMISPAISVGVGLKILNSKASNSVTYSSIALDALAAWKKDGLTVVGGIRNLGSGVTSKDGTKYALPSSVALGADYCLAFGEAFNLGLEADLDYYFAGALGIAAAAQLDWKEHVFARAGYHMGGEGAPLPSFASAGFGVKFFGVHLDATYLLASETLGGTMMFGLGYSF